VKIVITVCLWKDHRPVVLWQARSTGERRRTPKIPASEPKVREDYRDETSHEIRSPISVQEARAIIVVGCCGWEACKLLCVRFFAVVSKRAVSCDASLRDFRENHFRLSLVIFVKSCRISYLSCLYRNSLLCLRVLYLFPTFYKTVRNLRGQAWGRVCGNTVTIFLSRLSKCWAIVRTIVRWELFLRGMSSCCRELA